MSFLLRFAMLIALASTLAAQLTITAPAGNRADVSANQNLNFVLNASGGTPPYTWAITSGTLPAGLCLAPNGFIRCRTSAVGTSPITLRVTDALGATQSRAVNIVVSPVTAVEWYMPPAAVGQEYSRQLRVVGGLGPYSWTIENGSLPAGLGLNPATGLISGIPVTGGTSNVALRITDSLGNIAFQLFSIRVFPVAIGGVAMPMATVGVPYSHTFVASNNAGSVTWSLETDPQFSGVPNLPPGLTLNSVTGQITGTPTGAGAHIFTLRATDASSNVGIRTAGLIVRNSASMPLQIWGGDPNDITEGEYNGFRHDVVGGVAPYTWSIVSGSLPPGMALSNSSEEHSWGHPQEPSVSGTSTQNGIYTYTLQVQDSAGAIATKTVRVAVSDLAMNQWSLPSGTLGVAYNTMLTGGFGTPPYSWSIVPGTSMPAGLTINPSTGLLSGTPVECGTFEPVIRLADNAGNQILRKMYNFFIACGGAGTISIQNAPATIVGFSTGREFIYWLPTAGGNGTQTWTITSGSLPPGMRLLTGAEAPQGINPGGAALGGVPTTPGTYPVQLRVEDSQGRVGIRHMTIVVTALQILKANLPNAILGQPYLTTVAASGNIAPLTYSVIFGDLPAGLSINSSTGVISGTPLSVGNQGFTVMATDGSNTVYAGYGLNVESSGITTNTTMPFGTVNQAYNASLAAVGGGPYTFSAQGLPPGLSINGTTGVISGVPTEVGLWTSNITLNSASGSSTRTFTFLIRPSASGYQPRILTSSTNNWDASVGQRYDLELRGDGVAPFTWTLVGGSLPPGLNLLTGQDTPVWANTLHPTLGGWPTTPGLYTFSLKMQDATGAYAVRTFVLRVSRIRASTPVPQNTQLNQAITNVQFTASGGTGPYLWSIVEGFLPEGLTLSPSGILSGTPVECTGLGFTVEIRDSTTPANILRRPLGMFPSCGTAVSLDIPSGKFISLNPGTPIQRTFPVRGGTGPYTWSVAPGSFLPAGLSLSPAGVLTGSIATAGTTSTAVRVTDSAGNIGQRIFTFSVTPLVTPNPGLPNVAVGGSTNIQLPVLGGTGPYTFQVPLYAEIPAGMTISSTGVLSGTPLSPGGFGFDVYVRDSAGNTRLQNYFVTVDPIVITPGILPAIVQNNAYNQTLTATGGTAPYTWSIAGGSLPGGVTLSSAGVISGTTGSSDSNFFVQIRATDAAGRTGTKTYGLPILPAPPTIGGLRIGGGDGDDPTVGEAYTSGYIALGGTPGNNGYTYALASGSSLPPGFTLLQGSALPQWINPVGFALSGVPATPGNYTIPVVITDTAGRTATRVLPLHVSKISMQPSNTTLASGTLGVAHTGLTFTASGGTGPYTWTALDDIPAGLMLSSGGVLSGTPTECGAFNFRVRATDSGTPSDYVTKRYNINIGCGTATSLSINGFNKRIILPRGNVNFTFNPSNGTGPYTWSLAPGTSLPAGLEFVQDPGSNNVTIRGSITTPGTYPFGLRVQDSSNPQRVGQRMYLLEITPLTVQRPAFRNPVVGTPFTTAFTASGGTGPYTYSLWPGDPLPGGLTLTSGGVLSGTPTADGNYGFTVVSTDAVGNRGTVFVPVTVAGMQITSGPTLPTAIQNGASYSQTLTASGSTQPYTWSAYAALPAGLTLSSSGLLSGVVTAGVGTSNVPVQVMGADGRYARTILLLPVQTSRLPQGLQFTTGTSLGSTTVGQLITNEINVTGGTPPYTFALTSGSLPPGLSLISGTSVPSDRNPGRAFLWGNTTTPGTYTFTLRATDAAAAQVSRTFTMRIGSMSVSPTAASQAGTYNAPFSLDVNAYGTTGPFTYATVGNPLPKGVTLNASTGILSGTPLETGQFNITIRASDAGSPAATFERTYNLTINPSGSNALALSYPTQSGNLSVLTNRHRNNTVQHRIDVSGGTGPYTWSITEGALPPGVFLISRNSSPDNYPTDGSSASLSGIAKVSGTYNFTIRVDDSSGKFAIRNLTQVISPIGISEFSFPPAFRGKPYTRKFSAFGGTAPYTWRLATEADLPGGPGAPPPGMTLSSAGVLSGTPTVPGTYNFTIHVEDSAGQSYNLGTSLIVYAFAVETPDLVTIPRNGSAFTYDLTSSGGTGTITWDPIDGIGSIPGGLTLGANGTLSGVPNCGGNFSTRVRATDAEGNESIKRILFSCLAVPSNLVRINAASALPNLTVGQPLDYALNITEGTPPYTVALAPGSTLPAGLMILNDVAEIAGNVVPRIPRIWGSPLTVGNYTFTLIATDAGGKTFNRTFTLKVSPLSVGQFSIHSWTRGTPYSQQLDGGFGTAPYTWSTTGPLPRGITLSSSGLISGTPLDTGTHNIPFTITDAAGLTYTRTLNLNISSETAATINLPSGLANTSYGEYNQTITPGGGREPYTFSIEAGSLPPGIVMLPSATNVVLRGFASAAGTYTFTLKATDADGNTGYRTYTVVMSPMGVPFTGLSGATMGQPYTQTLSVTGGTGPYSYTLETDQWLPPGLTLSSGGVLSGTPTVSGSYSFRVTVADSTGKTISPTYSITIGSAVRITTDGLLSSAVRGSAYTPVTLAATGGAGPYTYSLAGGSFPTGLNITSAGVIAGTVGANAAFGSYAPIIRVTDANGLTNTKVFNLHVMSSATPAPLTINNGENLGYSTVNQTLSILLQALQGTPPYTWSVESGTLPPGMALASGTSLGSNDRPGATRLLGHTTTAGTYTFTLKVTDAANTTATRTFTLVVTPLGLQPLSLPNAIANSMYSTQIRAINGTGPYTFSLLPNSSLPTGLSMNSSGLITGTPTSTGTTNFSLRLQDNAGNVIERTLTLAVGTTSTLYSISGQVTAGGAALMGATVTLTGGAGGSQTTTAAGTYSFTGLTPGVSYTVTATKAQSTFVPPSVTFDNLQSNQTANFTANSAVRGDFNSDSRPDIIFQDQTSGWAQVWFLGGVKGTSILNAANLTTQNTWRIVAIADFNRDGRPDVVWQDTAGAGAVQVWYLGGTGTQIIDAANLVGSSTLRVAATADLNQDGSPDVIWQDPATGVTTAWLLGGTRGLDVLATAAISGANAWRIAAAGDFNNDGRTDVIWQDQSSGFAQIWFLGGTQGTTFSSAVNLVQTNPWRIAATGDFNQDGRVDLMWQDPVSGASQAWFMGGPQGNQILDAVAVGGPNAWRIAGPR